MLSSWYISNWCHGNCLAFVRMDSVTFGFKWASIRKSEGFLLTGKDSWPIIVSLYSLTLDALLPKPSTWLVGCQSLFKSPALQRPLCCKSNFAERWRAQSTENWFNLGLFTKTNKLLSNSEVFPCMLWEYVWRTKTLISRLCKWFLWDPCCGALHLRYQILAGGVWIKLFTSFIIT